MIMVMTLLVADVVVIEDLEVVEAVVVEVEGEATQKIVQASKLLTCCVCKILFHI